jgi:hypothetical protein
VQIRFRRPAGAIQRRFRTVFTDYDKFPYASERQISGCIDSLSLAAKRVLEIGLGQGSECELLIRLGALWAGVDQARQVG